MPARHQRCLSRQGCLDCKDRSKSLEQTYHCTSLRHLFSYTSSARPPTSHSHQLYSGSAEEPRPDRCHLSSRYSRPPPDPRPSSEELLRPEYLRLLLPTNIRSSAYRCLPHRK